MFEQPERNFLVSPCRALNFLGRGRAERSRKGQEKYLSAQSPVTVFFSLIPARNETHTCKPVTGFPSIHRLCGRSVDFSKVPQILSINSSVERIELIVS